MIKIIYPLFLSFILIIIQTTIFPYFSFFYQCFDLIIISILYISIFFSHPIMIIGIVFQGYIMDSISGTPFGYYIISYVWIYLCVQILKKFISTRDFILIPVLSLISVFIENIFLFFIFFIKYGKEAVVLIDFIIMLEQMVLAFIFVTPFILILRRFEKPWNYFIEKIFEKITP